MKQAAFSGPSGLGPVMLLRVAWVRDECVSCAAERTDLLTERAAHVDGRELRGVPESQYSFD